MLDRVASSCRSFNKGFPSSRIEAIYLHHHHLLLYNYTFMPAAVHCSICLSHVSIDKFVVFPCGKGASYGSKKIHTFNALLYMSGHGFCVGCKNRMFQVVSRSKCPNCRIQIRDREGHPLFLELVSSKASSIVEGLGKMNHETPLLSVRKAGDKLAKVLQGPELEPDLMVRMWLSSLISSVLFFSFFVFLYYF